MRNTSRKIMRLTAVFATCIGFAVGTQAATVTLTTGDAFGETSFNTGLHWSDATAPHAGNDYVVPVEWLRTPTVSSSTYTFMGDSLILTNGGGFIFKSDDSTHVISNMVMIGNCRIWGGNSGGNQGTVMNGSLTVYDDAGNSPTIYANQSGYTFNMDISGPGHLNLDGGDQITFTGTNDVAGGISVAAGTKTFNSTSVSMFTIGASGVNNAITGSGAVFDGTFIFDLTGASTTIGNSWTITTAGATFGSNFIVDGFFDNGDGSWYLDNGSAKYKYYQNTGVLQVVSANVVPVYYDSQSPTGANTHPQPIITATLYDGDPDVVLTGTVALKVNGSDVTSSTSITAAGAGTNVVSYTPAAPYASGSTNNVELTFQDTGAVAYTSSWQFVVANYAPVSTNAAYALSYTNTAERGYWFRDVGWGVIPDPKIWWNNFPSDALSALLYEGDFNPSNDVTAVETNGMYFFSDDISSSNVINFSDNIGDNDGHFNSLNGWVEDAWPSIGDGNFASDILGYVQLDVGVYQFGLGCDWGSVGLWLDDTPSDYFNTTPWLTVADRGADALGTINVTQAGLYPVRIVFNRRNDNGADNNWGCAIELWTVKPDGTRVLVNDTANGGVPMWRAGDVLLNAYTKSIKPKPDSYIAPSQDIQVQMDGNFDDSSIVFSLNGSPMDFGVQCEYLLDTNSFIKGVQIINDSVLVVNQSNDLQLVYSDLGTGESITNNWAYDVANYIEYITGTPSGTLFTNNSPYVEAKIQSLTGTLNTGTVQLLLDGSPLSPLDINTGATNTVGFQTSGLAQTEHTATVIYEANEGGGLSTNSWTFEVHPTTTEKMWNINIAGVPGGQIPVTDGVIAVGPSAGLNQWNNLAGVNNGSNNATNDFVITDVNGANPINMRTYGSQFYGTADAATAVNVHQEMFQGWVGANAPMNMTTVISNLNSANSYDIYLYSTWRWTQNTVDYNVTEGYGNDLSGSVTETQSNVAGDGATDYTGCVEGQNYIILSGVTPTMDGRIVFTGQCSDGVMSGLQIVEHAGAGHVPDVDVVSLSPANGAVIGNLSPTLEVVYADLQVTATDAQLLLDGTPVSYDSLNKVGTTTTVSYATSNLSNGVHTWSVIALPGSDTNSWSFEVKDPEVVGGIYIWTNAPSANGDDIAQMTYGTSDAGNTPVPGSTDDEYTYVAGDRCAQGQTFTTGTSNTYALGQIWVKQAVSPTYSSTWQGAQVKVRITDPSQAGTAGFVIYDSTLTVSVVGDSTSLTSGGGTGSPYWLQFTLGTNITLSGNTTYGFDLAAGSPYFEIAGTSNNVYAAGSAYGSEPTVTNGSGNDNASFYAGDRAFLLRLTGSGYGGPVAGPTVSLSIPAGGPVTLAWPTSAGTFNVLTNGDLVNGVWADAGLVPYIDGDNYVVTNGIGGELNLFYKLSN